MSINVGNASRVQFTIPQTELLAGTAIEVIAPASGYITEVGTTVQTAITTGGTVSVKIGATTVQGSAVTVASAATKGTINKASTTAGDATRKVTEGDRLQIVPASFATAGALAGYVKIASSDINNA